MSIQHHMIFAHGAINYIFNIFNQSISIEWIPEIWHNTIIILILKPGKDNNIVKNWRQISLLCPAVKTLKNVLLSKMLTHITIHRLNMAFFRNTRHALHCRRSLPTFLPFSQEKCRLSEQCSSRSIRQLHSTMWTIIYCSIMSSTPSCRQ